MILRKKIGKYEYFYKAKKELSTEKLKSIVNNIISKTNEHTSVDKIKELIVNNKSSQESEIHTCEACAKHQANYKLEEWLNFDLRSIKGKILEAIESDNFTDIAAQSRKEIYMGKFNKAQVEELRSVLFDGVTEGKTLNEIAEDISKKIKLRDRYILNDAGEKVLHTSKEARGLQIAQSEITRLGNTGKLIDYEEKGLKEVIFKTSSDACDVCESKNGNKFSITEAYGILPIHPNCRCSFTEK
jgi:SPP1 gp7 family putative phage head morphogenesis protein